MGEEDPVLARFPVAAGLIQKANCRSCHLAQGQLVGPGFDRIAERYLGQADAMDGLVKKIVQGGRGVWGDNHASQCLITGNEAREIFEIHPQCRPGKCQTGAQWSLPIGKSRPGCRSKWRPTKKSLTASKLLIQASYKILAMTACHRFHSPCCSNAAGSTAGCCQSPCDG